ncbi:Hypp4533 [Branchiostoma lanceolatum]|uniref:Hypp4533 protein n=1 Tax=Branchiostoma lanceolatum TaxID=7740 RepID=A0A8K0A8K6_BRALA|nr:Hypp4533 [Branchiostoma lanceolatum]
MEVTWTSNTTLVNKTDDDSSTNNSTASIPTTDVDAIPTPSQTDSIFSTQTRLEQSQRNILVIVLAVPAVALLGTVAFINLAMRRFSGRHNDETIEEDPGNSREIPDARSHGNDADATVDVPGKGNVPAYWEIPDDYFCFNNPGYRYRCSSLPTDYPVYWEIPDDYFDFNNPGYRYRCSSLPMDYPIYWEIPDDYFDFNNPRYRRYSLQSDGNPYWQIPDEYYNCENTARQAKWRPSSLPLTLGVTYENVGQAEHVERWQWQPSDLDAQDEDDVITFYAAAAEVALPELRNMSTAHAHYKIPVRLNKCAGCTNRAAEIREKTGGAAYGRPGPKKQRPFEFLAKYGWRAVNIRSVDQRMARYGTRSITHPHYENEFRMSRDQKINAWGIRHQDRHNREYAPTEQTDASQTARSAPVLKSSSEILKTYHKRDGYRLHKSWSQEKAPADRKGAAHARIARRRRLSL